MDSTSSIKTFPGFEHLYVLRDATYEESFHASFDIPKDREYSQLLKTEWTPKEPLIAKWFLGASEPDEIVPGGAVEIVFLSNRVRKLLESAKLTGWSTYAVTVQNKAGQVCEGYAGLSITGRCGPIDEERGELLPGQVQNTRFPEYRGIYFDESTWDGSDFFCPSDKTVYKFASEAVKKVFEDNGITGIEFTPLTEATRYRSLKKEKEESVIPPEEIEEHTVVYPYENAYGLKAHVCRSFAEAKEFALNLQSQGTEAQILKGHEVVWSSVPHQKS